MKNIGVTAYRKWQKISWRRNSEEIMAAKWRENHESNIGWGSVAVMASA